MYYVYLLQSMVDKTFYVGYSSDLKARIARHNQGLSTYTSNKRPWKLIYYESYLAEKDAKAREQKLKHHGKAYTQLLTERLVNSLNEG